MLLAAGLGTRLWPLTADRPKCMVPVGGRAVLLRNLDWLLSQGIDEVVINLHHRGQVVVDAIGDGSRLGIKVVYSREAKLLGTAGGVLAARRLIGDDTFLIIYADNLFDIRLGPVIDGHRRSGATVTMTLIERDDVSSSGVALQDEDSWITEFQEKPSAGTERSHWVNAGLLVCEPAVYDAIPAMAPTDLSVDVMSVLAHREHALHGHRLAPDERVMWIDTADDLRSTEAEVAPQGGTSAR